MKFHLQTSNLPRWKSFSFVVISKHFALNFYKHSSSFIFMILFLTSSSAWKCWWNWGRGEGSEREGKCEGKSVKCEFIIQVLNLIYFDGSALMAKFCRKEKHLSDDNLSRMFRLLAYISFFDARYFKPIFHSLALVVSFRWRHWIEIELHHGKFSSFILDNKISWWRKCAKVSNTSLSRWHFLMDLQWNSSRKALIFSSWSS